jgi:hypothetical protein
VLLSLLKFFLLLGCVIDYVSAITREEFTLHGF